MERCTTLVVRERRGSADRGDDNIVRARVSLSVRRITRPTPAAAAETPVKTTGARAAALGGLRVIPVG